MKKILLALSLMICCSGMAQEKPDTMWVQFDDRFVENEIIDLTHIDSLEFQTSTYKLYKYYPNTDIALRIRAIVSSLPIREEISNI